jgi:ankyrin repeat protein
VKQLLAKDGVSPDSRSKYGRTPLLLAAKNGRDMVVKLLLEKDDVDPDSKDTNTAGRRWCGPQQMGTAVWSICCSPKSVLM